MGKKIELSVRIKGALFSYISMVQLWKRGGCEMKKNLFVLLSMLLLFSLLPKTEVKAAGFPDVTQYDAEITYLTDQKVINGYPDGTFKPARDLTRLQAVTMILREKGITNYAAPNPNFSDIKPGDYGYEVVAKAVQMGFISGKTNKDGSKFFDASASLTRGQMAKILVEGYALPKTKGVSFTDVQDSNTFKDYISVLATENITTGYADGSFDPNNTLSRQHFAVFMARMLEDRFKPAPTPAPKPKTNGEIIKMIKQFPRSLEQTLGKGKMNAKSFNQIRPELQKFATDKYTDSSLKSFYEKMCINCDMMAFAMPDEELALRFNVRENTRNSIIVETVIFEKPLESAGFLTYHFTSQGGKWKLAEYNQIPLKEKSFNITREEALQIVKQDYLNWESSNVKVAITGSGYENIKDWYTGRTYSREYYTMRVNTAERNFVVQFYTHNGGYYEM